jgi:hypothetical protein
LVDYLRAHNAGEALRRTGRWPQPVLMPRVAAEPQVWSALAILVGASPDALAGTQLLVDANGWLRAVSRSGASIQIGQARDIIAHPLPIDAAGPIGHHH